MDEPAAEESSPPPPSPPLEEEAKEDQPTSQESSDESQNEEQIQEKPAPTPNAQPSTEQQPATDEQQAITEEVEAEKPAQPKKDFSKAVADVKETLDLSQTVASSPSWDLADFQHTIRFLQPSGNTWVPVPTPAEQNASTSTRYGIEYLVKLPDTAPRVQPGDTLTITLPNGITGTGSKALQMPSGETIANLVANGSTATITFTNNVLVFNDINLNILVDVRVFNTSQTENTKKTVTIDKIGRAHV